MNTTATLTNSNTTTNYNFNITHEGNDYEVTVYLNECGKFIDDTITFPNGEELAYEEEEGEIREAIMDYLDENWDKLV
jgi:uncharacterized protein YuzB (UPF0349 family)